MTKTRLLQLIGIFLLVLLILALVESVDIYLSGKQSIVAAMLEVIHGVLHTLLSIAPQVIVAFLLLFLVWLVIHWTLPKSTLTLEGFSNGVGVNLTEEERSGLCAAAHAQLLDEMQDLQHQLRFHQQATTRTLGALGKYSVTLPILREKTVATEMSAFSAALSGALSDKWKWLGTLLDFLFRPGHVTIKGTLEYLTTPPTKKTREDDAESQRVAIIFEVSETQSQTEPAIYEVSQALSPNNDHATSGRRPPRPPLSSYYTELLPRASRSLARELLKRRMVNSVPLIYRLLRFGERYRAEVYNLFGLLEQQCCKEGDGFYVARAVADFRQAINACENWYQPFANLADTLSVEGQRELLLRNEHTTDENNQAARALQAFALDEYHEADIRVKRPLMLRERALNYCARRTGRLGGQASPKQLQADQADLLRLSAYRARALAGELPPQRFIDAVKSLNRPPKQETDARILYYAACCYALAYGLAQQEELVDRDAQAHCDNYRTQAATYLAYSLARICLNKGCVPNAASLSGKTAQAAQHIKLVESINDPIWYYWRRAETDPDLASIQSESLVSALKSRLHQELAAIFQPSGETLSFFAVVDKAIGQALKETKRHSVAQTDRRPADLRWSALEIDIYEAWSELLG